MFREFYLFQSLTGSIHTKDLGIGSLKIWDPFQSLTGSIHTINQVLSKAGHKNVSIPHRFNSHMD